MASSIELQQQHARVKALCFPREHGAWGLLLVPLVTGACVAIPYGHAVGTLALFVTAALSLFWLRTPVESLLGLGLMKIGNDEEKHAVLKTIGIVAPFAAVSMTAMFWGGHNAGLLLIGCLCGVAFAAQSALKLAGRKARMLAQIVGSIGLTSTAAAAYYAMTGRLDARAFAVWFASWVFAGDQIHFVQIRLRNSRLETWADRARVGRNFLVGQVLMLAVIAALSFEGYLPMWTAVAFLPVFVRGCAWVVTEAKGLNLQWLGISELLHSVAFGALLTVAFYLGH